MRSEAAEKRSGAQLKVEPPQAVRSSEVMRWTAEGILLVSLGTGTKQPGRAPELDDVPQLVDGRT